ncbi:flagellar motor protein MotA [Inmirania thermothiophila]|uniref:Flagellar motor protein MotA n=1 Tax=Inmirania thermothiophila TaxID=1750597 RepID=A0A3N1Y9E1_9GAMM|nr:flagellar motor protein MotA [Inmirania thermothiophila]ROR34232.1 hypothetical protein EDC57_0128 [Inmirania thermothiophila]
MSDRVPYWMSVFLVAVAAAATALFPALQRAFLANPVFNGMILAVLLVGVVLEYRQVLGLAPERRWLARLRAGVTSQPAPHLLAPLARLLAERERPRLSTQAARALLDGIRLRLDEQRDLSRYLVGLLVFLGLLGTFWGLLDTVSAAAGVIAGLSVEGELASVFEQLKANLQAPLAGMGTAFSSSLFGLGGALVLGFLDLQAGHAQNRFYNDLEEWLAELTHLPSGALEAEQPLPAYLEALIERSADSLEALQRLMARSEEERAGTRQELLELTRRLAELADRMREEQQVIRGLTRQQAELQAMIGRLAEAAERWGPDEAAREHLRNLDLGLARLAEETVRGREAVVETLRGELRLLARTLAGRDG